MAEQKESASPRWAVWAGVAVVAGCLITIVATLNDIF